MRNVSLIIVDDFNYIVKDATARTAASEAQATANSKLSDAPSDGKQYARKDGEWSEVEATDPSLPTGGTIGQVLAKRSDTDGDAGWYSLRHLPSDKWYLVDGITESDVIAAYQFVNRLDEAEALLNVNNGVSYPLSKVGTVTWSADKGFSIPTENKSGLHNSTLYNMDIDGYQSGFFGYNRVSDITNVPTGGITNKNNKRRLYLKGAADSVPFGYCVSYNNNVTNYASNSFVQKGVLGANWGLNTELFHNGSSLSLTNSGTHWGGDTNILFGQHGGSSHNSYYYTAIVLYNITLTAAQAIQLSDNIHALGGID